MITLALLFLTEVLQVLPEQDHELESNLCGLVQLLLAVPEILRSVLLACWKDLSGR